MAVKFSKHPTPWQVLQAAIPSPSCTLLFLPCLQCSVMFLFPLKSSTLLASKVASADYQAPLAGANALGSHHLVEAMKDAFALRMQLGDPGSNNTYLNLQSTLRDMLSLRFANTLR